MRETIELTRLFFLYVLNLYFLTYTNVKDCLPTVGSGHTTSVTRIIAV